MGRYQIALGSRQIKGRCIGRDAADYIHGKDYVRRRRLQSRRFFAGLARSSMARQLREVLCATELADNFYLLASRRAADRRKSSTSRRRTRLGCQSGSALSHQRMTSVAMFTVKTTYWRSGPIIIYIYQLDLTIKLVSGEPW